MFFIGQKVRHQRTGDTGKIASFNQTFNPITSKTYYHFLIDGDDGRQWIEGDRALDFIPFDGSPTIPPANDDHDDEIEQANSMSRGTI